MSRWLVSVAIAVLACLGLASVVGAVEIHVRPDGNDQSTGTAAKPLATLARAQATVRQVLRTQPDEPVTGVVHGGTYRLAEPWVFGPEDSGTAARPVTYTAAAGEAVVISGGRLITGWQADAQGRWKAKCDLDLFRQLYVGGKRAARPRGPAPRDLKLFGNLGAPDARAGYTTAQVEMAGWKNVADIEFGYFNSWSHMICKVAAIERGEAARATIVMQQPGFYLASRKEGVQAREPAYVENAFELLGEAGQWYHDRPARTIHYVPRPGEDMTRAEVEAPALECLLLVKGTLDTPVHDVTFRDLTFACAGWVRPSRMGHADVQANFVLPQAPERWLKRKDGLQTVHNEHQKSPANVVVDAALRIRFERCEFTRLGGAGLDLQHGAQANEVVGCHFHDISASAIQIGDVLAEDHHPADPRLITKDNRVLNCSIHDIGVEYEDSVGVFAGYTEGTVIAHNEIWRLPYTGISVGWGWGEEDAGGGAYEQPFRYLKPTTAKGNIIEANHIHHVMQRRHDGGGVYTLSIQPGTAIRGNHIHDNPHGPGGIYLDEGSGEIEVTGNVVYAVPKPMNYNNAAQNRRATCREHDNFFGITPDAPGFPRDVAVGAGPEDPYRAQQGGRP
jgi:hypothetical protein